MRYTKNIIIVFPRNFVYLRFLFKEFVRVTFVTNYLCRGM
jgi:hypothetical protein